MTDAPLPKLHDPELERLLAEEEQLEREEAERRAGADRWWEDHANLVTLTAYLADCNYTAREVAHAVEKPWKFRAEYEEALRE